MLSLPTRKYLPHNLPFWIPSETIFFITINCNKRGINQLCNHSIAAAVFETVEFRQNRGDWYVDLLLLMPDHLHALISFPFDREMTRVISNWKETTAKNLKINWQRDFFDHRLRHNESYEEKANYIRNNPVRKEFVSRAAEWPFCWEPKNGGPSGPALPPLL